MIQLFDVTKRYPGGRTALHEVSLSISVGELVWLIGPSGAGKTTLLRLIYREEVPTSGHILVNGRNVASLPRRKVPALRRSVGVVFQDFRLIARKTVLENVSFLLRVLGASPNERRRRAYLALRRVGLAHRMSAFPRELSAGEQQRVAIARALVGQPEVLVADEPTGNLDPDLSYEILQLLEEVQRAGTTVLVATHDPLLIERRSARVLMLDDGCLVADRRTDGFVPGVAPIPDVRPDMAGSRRLWGP
ncbi:MAG: cell division ATP-binding protein FtsE [Thermoanaerobaculia bacterium]